MMNTEQLMINKYGQAHVNVLIVLTSELWCTLNDPFNAAKLALSHKLCSSHFEQNLSGTSSCRTRCHNAKCQVVAVQLLKIKTTQKKISILSLLKVPTWSPHWWHPAVLAAWGQASGRLSARWETAYRLSWIWSHGLHRPGQTAQCRFPSGEYGWLASWKAESDPNPAPPSAGSGNKDIDQGYKSGFQIIVFQ